MRYKTPPFKHTFDVLSMANSGWSEFGYLLSPLGVLDRLVDVGHANLVGMDWLFWYCHFSCFDTSFLYWKKIKINNCSFFF